MNEQLTSQQLAEILAGKTGRDRTEVETFLAELVTIINEAVFNEQAVQVKGLGAFKVRLARERKGLDAKTQETVVIPPHHKLFFVPEESFGKLVNRQFEPFSAESRETGDKLPAGLHLSGAEEETEEEETIDNKNTETMEEKYYSIPPVPAGMSGSTADGGRASAGELPAESRPPEITGAEKPDEETQLLSRPFEDSGDEETHYAGGFDAGKPDEETQLLDRPFEDSGDEETHYAGGFDADRPDEETQLLNRPFEDSGDEETHYAGGFDAGKPDEETQLLNRPFEDLGDEETHYAGGFNADRPDEETQLIGMSVPPENTREEETQFAGGYGEEPPLPPADSTNAGKKVRFNPTQIALAAVLLLVLCGGIGYLLATRGSGLFHRDRNLQISGESFALPGDSAALEQARRKANVTPEADPETTGTTDSVSSAGTPAPEAPVPASPRPERT
ncbi:MAG: HU family DNA-binding protein, partial [Tannerella sp.]|nr:HU family DNA-binding protein [Tannerella sp.]